MAMRLDFWAGDALTGTVLGKLDIEGANFSRSLWGGGFSGRVLVEALTLDGGVDWTECERRMGLVAPGARTVIVTGTRMTMDGELVTGDDPQAGAGYTLIGEWPVRYLGRDTSARRARVECFAWEEYPSYLAQDLGVKRTNVNPAIVAREVLERVFARCNVDVPAHGSGNPVRVDIDRPIWSGQWADVLTELQEQDQGFEWIMGLNPVWDGAQLVRVERRIHWGFPEVQHALETRLESGEWGERHGNCTVIGGKDFARYSRRVIGIGAGEGGKQIIVPSNGALVPGQLDATRTLRVSNMRHASGVGQAAAAQRYLSLFDPLTIEVDINKILYLLRVGDVPHLYHRRSPTWPWSIDQQLRVGEISFSAQGNIVQKQTVKAAYGFPA